METSSRETDIYFVKLFKFTIVKIACYAILKNAVLQVIFSQQDLIPEILFIKSLMKLLATAEGLDLPPN